MKIEASNLSSLATKLYTWSLVFEPLLFFVVGTGGQSTGVPPSLSKLLQFFVLLIFIFRVITTKWTKLSNQVSLVHINKFFLYYFSILLFSSLIGIVFLNSYEVNINNALNNQYQAPFLTNNYIRPFFDIFIIIYYYFYFIILAKYHINTEQSVEYLFKCIVRTFYVVLVFGFIDLWFSLLGGDLIKRHIGESIDVGFRFHSFAGEPRDAFVYLIFGGLILIIYNANFVEIKFKKTTLIIIIVALMLTQSFSGIFGIFIGGVLALCYFILNLNRKAFYFMGISLAISYLIFYFSQYSVRIGMYVDSLSGLYNLLKTGQELPYLLKVQSVNFLPVWGLYNKLLDYNLIQFMFGSGFSSSAYYNMNYIGDLSFTNPHSQITRLLYEGGIFGTILYLLFLTKPVLTFLKTLPVNLKNYSIFIFFMITGSSLSHRSLIPFILLGIILAYNNVYRQRIVLL